MAARDARVTGAEQAKLARGSLASALGQLQALADPASQLPAAVTHAANAANALYRAEAESTTGEATAAGIRIAVDELTQAMKLLTELRATRSDFEVPLTTVARTLALLYPIARASARQRREVHFEVSRASIPPLGNERRSAQAQRVHVEVDIGMLTQSNFYTGISLDVSQGGVFVSTYQPSPPGTEVSLYFVLPSGHSVHAEGTVRWTRAPSDDFAPGMGVAFTALSEADARAIGEFCAGRTPLYYDE
jgi:uncharacterized protein (TIGR02266 family)